MAGRPPVAGCPTPPYRRGAPHSSGSLRWPPGGEGGFGSGAEGPPPLQAYQDTRNGGASSHHGGRSGLREAPRWSPLKTPTHRAHIHFPASPGSQTLLCPGTVWITMFRHEQELARVLICLSFFQGFPWYVLGTAIPLNTERRGKGIGESV